MKFLDARPNKYELKPYHLLVIMMYSVFEQNSHFFKMLSYCQFVSTILIIMLKLWDFLFMFFV